MPTPFETPEARQAESASGLNDPKTQRIAQQVLQQLLRGLNTMQMQAGLAPGGATGNNPFIGTMSGGSSGGVSGITPTRGGPPPSMSSKDFATQARLEFTQHAQLQALQSAPASYGGGMTPVARPTAYQMAAFMPPPSFPGSGFGSSYGAIHQTQALQVNQQMAGAQAVGGLAARHLGTMPFGAGALYAEHRGIGQGFQNMGMNMFQPLIHHRAAALQMQNASMQFYRGSADTNISGVGLSAVGSSRIVHGLDRMSDSSGFKNATGGMFNRQDVSKITDLAAQMGMLGEARTADQITQAVGRISRGLSTFMRVAGQPDVQEAMRSMAQMHHMGMTVPEMTVAGRNAARFGRMAGVDAQTIMSQGMAGAGVFQQAGLSGGAGLSAGMAAAGMSPQLASLMGANRASLAGGAAGIQQTLMGGAAHSATINALLPAMLTRRGGHLAIDQEALRGMVSGDMSMSDMARQGASRIRQLGGRSALMELSTRQSELQDEASRRMGGQLSTLMPLIQARALMREHPGTFTLGSALRTMGLGEQQARTYEQMGNDPRFWESMQQSAREEQREQRREIAEERRVTRSAARMGPTGREMLRRVDRVSDSLSSAADHVHDIFARAQDRGEEAAMIEAEGGTVLRDASGGYRLGTQEGAAQVGRQLRTRDGREAFRQTGTRAMALAQQRIQGDEQRQELMAAYTRTTAGNALLNPSTMGFAGAAAIANQFVGGPMVGMFGPRGQTMRETVESGDSLLARTTRNFGLAPSESTESIERRGAALAQMSGVVGAAQSTSTAGRISRTQSIDTLMQRTLGTPAGRAGQRDTGRRIATASGALNTYLEAHGGTGASLVHGGATPDGMRQAIRQGLLAGGDISVEQVDAIMQSPAIVEQVIAVGTHGRSPEAQRALDVVERTGADVTTQGGARAAAAMRAGAADTTRGALAALGVDTGFFGSSEEQQRRVLSHLSGTGPEGEARRLVLARDALAAAALAGDEQAGAQAAAINTDLTQRFSQEVLDTAESAVAGSDLEAGILEDIGGTLSGLSPEAIEEALREQGGKVRDAQGQAAWANIAEAVGDAPGGLAAFNQGAGNLAEWVRGGGTLANATEQERRAMSGGGAGATRAAQAYIDRVQGSATGRTGVSGLAGSSEGAASRGGSFMESVTGGLQSFFGVNQEGDALTPGEAAVGEGAGGSFDSAVGTFQTASQRLLHAAELMEAASSMGQARNVAVGALSAANSAGGFIRGIFENIARGNPGDPGYRPP